MVVEGGGGQKDPSTSFSPVTVANVDPKTSDF